MKKLLIVLVIMLVATTAQGKGYMGMNGGAGPNGGNLGFDMGGAGDKGLIGFEFGWIMNGDSEVPSNTKDYPCPHGGYVKKGTYQRGSELSLNVKLGPKLGSKNVYLFALAGVSFAKEIELTRSRVTGWYYEQSRESAGHGFGGAGIGYFPPDSRLTLQLEADNRRGVVFGMGWRF